MSSAQWRPFCLGLNVLSTVKFATDIGDAIQPAYKHSDSFRVPDKNGQGYYQKPM